jgi:hypothetical protein
MEIIWETDPAVDLKWECHKYDQVLETCWLHALQTARYTLC